MALIEKIGTSGKMLGNMKEMVEGLEGGNIAGIIEWYKQIYGLNNLGGMQLYNMMKDKKPEDIMSDEFEKEVKKNVIDNNDYKSDSQLYKDMVNNLSQLGIKIGGLTFKTELETLTAAMKSLEDAFRGKMGLPPPEPIEGVSEEVLREHSNKSLPVSHSMIFNDAAIKPGTTGLDAYRQTEDKYFRTINDYDESRLLSLAPAMQPLIEEIPRMIADMDFSSTGRNNDFDRANYLIDKLAENIQTLVPVLRGLTNQAEILQRDGIPLTGDINVDGL